VNHFICIESIISPDVSYVEWACVPARAVTTVQVQHLDGKCRNNVWCCWCSVTCDRSVVLLFPSNIFLF